MIDALHTAGWIDLSDRDELRLALRSVLTTAPEELPVFDVTFDEFWRSRLVEGGDDHFTTRERSDTGRGRGEQLSRTLALEAAAHVSDDEMQSAAVTSPVEVLAERNFASFEPDELPQIKRAIRLVARRLATHASRRYRSARTGHGVDLRRTFRRNVQYGGTIVELARRQRKIRKPRIVLICDVSRSMETYSTFLLQFIYAMHDALGHVESFVFSTRLTRVTEYFARGSIDEALAQIAREAPDWAGGTRIGDSLHTFNAVWARRVIRRGTVVLVLSDGLDSGHYRVLEREMAELEQRAARIVWLNPLLGNAGYRVEARGMTVALPHVSVFASAHNVATLRALATQLLHA